MSSTPRLPDAVRISARGREILIKLKRYTGIPHWNAICRIAYCQSLAMATVPVWHVDKGDVAIEIDWHTFVGLMDGELSAITRFCAHRDVVSDEDLAKYVRAHVERGLNGLQNVRSISELVHQAILSSA